MKTNLICFFLAIILSGSVALADPVNLVKPEINDSVRVSELIQLSDQHLKVNFQEAKKYAGQAFSKSEDINCATCKSAALSQIGKVLWYNGEYPKAIEAHLNALKIRQEINDLQGMASNFHYLALIYYYMADYQTAIAYHQQSLNIYEELDDTDRRAKVLSHIGLVYHKQANYPLAIEFMLESARLRNQLTDYDINIYDITGIGTTFLDSSFYHSELEYLFDQLQNQLLENDPDKLATTYSNIAMSYFYLENYKAAIPYFKLNIELMESQNQMPYWNDLGRAYCKLEQCDSAKYAHNIALENARNRGTKISEAASLEYLGDAFFHNKEFIEAIRIYKECTALNESMNNRYSVGGNYYKIARSYLEIKKHDLALSQANKSLKIGEQIQAGHIIKNALSLLSQIYGITGVYKKAFELEKRYNLLQDSLMNGEAQYHLAMLQYQYDTERKQNELDRLDNENQIQSAQIKTQSIIIFSSIGILLLLLLLAIVLYARYHQKQRLFKLLSIQKDQISEKNTLLEKGNREKEVLLGEIHHRVKNNLQIISSLLSIQSSHMPENKAKRAVLEGQNRVKAMGLIHENLYKYHEFGRVNMKEYLQNLSENLIESFGYQTGNFKLDIVVEDIHLDVDSAIPIGLISNELITNSLKHGCGKTDLPCLTLMMNRKNGILEYMIRDNGPGIKFIKDDRSFGLKLVNELTKKLDGTMSIHGEPDSEINIQFRKFKAFT